MSFDWRPESKDRYFRKAEEAVKAAGFDDILQISKEQFAITKSTVKVYFKPIPREGKTRRWWEAKKSMSEHAQSQRKEPLTSRKVSRHGMSCKSASRHTVVSASFAH